MTEQVTLDDFERRVLAAAFQDGLMELLLGVYLLILGLILQTSAALIPFSLLLLLLYVRLYERLKQRLIYPRVGYVKLPVDTRTEVKSILLTTLGSLALLLAIIPILRWRLGPEQGWELWFQHIVPAAIGILIAFGPLWMSQTYAVRRGYFFAALSVLLGIVIPFMGDFTGYEAVGLACLLLGSLFLIVGGFLFARFVAQQPIEGTPHAES